MGRRERTVLNALGREKILGLKIDVDTYRGMKAGVPRLLSILSRFGLKGTFFLSMGPDSSGRALFQLLKNPLFLRKMFRTQGPRLYGIRTAFYGTLLPSPTIGLAFPDLVSRILSEGHEVEFHAWDHRRWQDELLVRPCGWIEDWFEKGISAYRKIVGKEPRSFGAPGWLVDERVFEIANAYPFEYLSCTRAPEPFIHDPSDLMEIPSDLPCLEELGPKKAVPAILEILGGGGIHVLPVHAEVEGGIWASHFLHLLERLREMDYSVLLLSEIRELLRSRPLQKRRFRMKLLPGRSVPCAV